jgi:hypothetical protein
VELGTGRCKPAELEPGKLDGYRSVAELAGREREVAELKAARMKEGDGLAEVGRGSSLDDMTWSSSSSLNQNCNSIYSHWVHSRSNHHALCSKASPGCLLYLGVFYSGSNRWFGTLVWRLHN